MKVVIDIPENDYWLACNYPDALISIYAHYIKKGILLPKKHGRLIDADAFMADICRSINEMTKIGIMVDGDYLWCKLEDALENAPTIVEAEGEE